VIVAQLQDIRLIYKSIAFLYTNNDQVEFKIKTIPFTLASKNKYLGINLPKYIQAPIRETTKH
jgi:hypothetical protein